MNKWKYHTSHSFDSDEKHINMYSQLYKASGVYVCIEGLSSRVQCAYSPRQLVQIERKLRKQFEEGKILNLEFGREITVTKDENGFYKELINE